MFHFVQILFHPIAKMFYPIAKMFHYIILSYIRFLRSELASGAAKSDVVATLNNERSDPRLFALNAVKCER